MSEEDKKNKKKFNLKVALTKEIGKIDGASTDSAKPKWWISFGNYFINKVMSGYYEGGVPQGRITMLSGPSGSGKSFILSNVIREALNMGMFVLVIDSEHAIDEEYLEKIGVDTTSDMYLYSSVKNLSSCAKTVQKITKMYNDARQKGTLDELPNLLVVVDSLDFLFVDGMLEEYEKSGEVGSDQGLHAKKLRQLLNMFVQDIKYIPAAMVVTKQVYVDQEKYASPPWKMAESIKYAVSQLLLITRLLNKNKETKEVNGIRLKVFGWKTRFTKPFQQIEVVVPYDTGLDPYDGLLEVAVATGIVEKNGGWYNFGDKKFQKSNFDSIKLEVFEKVKEMENLEIDAIGEDSVEELVYTEKKAAKEKKEKMQRLLREHDDSETED